MEDDIKVRFATAADLDFIRQDGHVTNEAAQRKIECCEAIVAERDGKRVGYARLEYLWSQVPYLAMIHVMPNQRWHGVGRAILSFIELFLHGKGYDALYSSSQVDEPPPQTWHRHMGFEECGIIAGINQGIGEVFFRKRLR